MIYVPDSEIERWLLEDVALGDVTTRSLGITQQLASISFIRRHAGCVSGLGVVTRLVQKLGLQVISAVADGFLATEGQVLLHAQGRAEAIHQAWKVSQNILEWCCGVANGVYALVQKARAVNPEVQIACTRKSIPGTRLLASCAVLDGGGILHRCGTAETVLVFANHRRLLAAPNDWLAIVAGLRKAAPEKTIMLEADTLQEAYSAMQAGPDLLQLDKFSCKALQQCVKYAAEMGLSLKLAATGGINVQNVAEYAATGVTLLVTSAPYYSKPADIKVQIDVAV